MIAKTLFFFVHIQLFDVVDEFLLQAVLVIIHTQRLFQSIGNTFLHFGYTLFLIGSDSLQQMGDVGDLLTELLFKGSSFLLTEVHQRTDSLFHSRINHSPFFLTQFLRFILGHHIRHAEQRGKPVRRIRYRYSKIFGYGTNLLVVSLHQCLIDGSGTFRTLFLFYPKAEIHLSAFQFP